MVMNEETWEIVSNRLTEDALESCDPIGYLGRYDGIPIIIDNNLKYNHIEVYEKWMYDAVVKYGKRSDTDDAGDVE